MDIIKEQFEKLCNTTPSDINEHLPTLYNYACNCESIIELGVRGTVSSWAFVYGLLNNSSSKKKILLNDISPCDITKLLAATENLDIDVTYEWKNDLELEITENVDMTFIDTWHVYAQLKRELDKYSVFTNKYIIMHDTTVDAILGETIRNGWNAVEQSEKTGFPMEEINCGLDKAIIDFLNENPNWKIAEKYTNNNGLTVLTKM